MSIKIWQAFKVPLSRLNEALSYLDRLRIEGELFPKFELIIETLKSKLDTVDALMEADRLITEASDNGMRGLFNLDSSIGVYIYKDNAYLIPYGFYARQEDIPDWMADYHYQDSTDSILSEEEDKSRAKMWGILLKLPQLVYVIFEGRGLKKYELERMYIKKYPREKQDNQ